MSSTPKDEVILVVEIPLIDPYYCEAHDWQGSKHTRCLWCDKGYPPGDYMSRAIRRYTPTAKNTPEKREVYCETCDFHGLRYWGEEAYYCARCYPTARHEQNLIDFYDELEN